MKQTSSKKVKGFEALFDRITKGMAEYKKKLLLDGVIKEIEKKVIV